MDGETRFQAPHHSAPQGSSSLYCLGVDQKLKLAFRVTIAVLCGALAFVVTCIAAISLWFDGKSYASPRDDAPTHVLLVGLDTRANEVGGLPDAMVLLDLETMEQQSISRDWENSRNNPRIPLVQKHLEVQRCQAFCGIVGAYVIPQLDGEKDLESRKEEGLESLRRVVELEYQIPTLAVIAFDLTWARSYLNHIGPITVEVESALPVGGKLVQGQLVEIKRYIVPGEQALSGPDLFWFARSREGTSNASRMSRQLQIVRGILSQRGQLEILGSTLFAQGYFLTDLTVGDILPLLMAMNPK